MSEIPQRSADAHDAAHDHYVATVNWLIARGRDDLIDEIADQYERPSCTACHAGS